MRPDTSDASVWLSEAAHVVHVVFVAVVETATLTTSPAIRWRIMVPVVVAVVAREVLGVPRVVEEAEEKEEEEAEERRKRGREMERKELWQPRH